jgi:hypothetical protein
MSKKQLLYFKDTSFHKVLQFYQKKLKKAAVHFFSVYQFCPYPEGLIDEILISSFSLESLGERQKQKFKIDL